MDQNFIRHRPRHIDFTLLRRLEIEREIVTSPVDQPAIAPRCPECESVMMYRGIGRLRSGGLVHYFECIHSHREVHSVSIFLGE